MTSTLEHPVDFEPSLIGEHVYASRRVRVRVDVASMLSVMICLLYLLPAILIVPNMTYAGRPALLVAMLLWCWWLLAHLNPRLVMTGPQPLRWVAGAFLLSTLLSYIAGLQRGLPTLEMNAQDFAILQTFEFLGVVLVAADGIPNWARLHGVMRVLLYCSAFMAFTAFLQLILRIDVTRYLVIPGLQLKGELAGLGDRGGGGLFRVSGTATHYIELSTVMAMAVPFAIHYARFAKGRRERRLFGTIAVLTGASVPIAISRTGFVALAAVLLVMVPMWRWRLRYNLLVVAGILTGVLSVVKPGLIGTLRVMFTGADNDPSIQGRTDDYASVAQWFTQRPWLGRGPRTLIPELYRVLDDQWLYSLVTGGIIGVLALAALHITCVTLAVKAMRRSTSLEDRHLCAALISAQFASVIVGFTFDSMSFTTFSTLLALMSGFCGAVWRFTHPARTVRTSAVRRFVD